VFAVTHILLVDDEPSIREFLRVVLSEAGYGVAIAADGEQALRVPGSFDLLLTDLRMPRMMGDELARQMRLRDPDLKVLYLTGYSDSLFDAKGQLWEGEAFLDKPATAEGVLEAIRTLLTEQVAGSS
jgi:two-component system cell cycle sensor histidine kinase/response regulator CckA